MFLIRVSYCINSHFYCSGENVTENNNFFSPALKLKILCVPVESMVNSIKS